MISTARAARRQRRSTTLHAARPTCRATRSPYRPTPARGRTPPVRRSTAGRHPLGHLMRGQPGVRPRPRHRCRVGVDLDALDVGRADFRERSPRSPRAPRPRAERGVRATQRSPPTWPSSATGLGASERVDDGGRSAFPSPAGGKPDGSGSSPATGRIAGDRSTCIHLSDERQRRRIAPSSHLVNPRYSITVRRVVQPPNNAVHNVPRSPIGDRDGRHRLLRHGYHSDAFSGLLCLGQFGNQPPLPFILPRSAFAGHEPIGVLLVQDARPRNQR